MCILLYTRRRSVRGRAVWRTGKGARANEWGRPGHDLCTRAHTHTHTHAVRRRRATSDRRRPPRRVCACERNRRVRWRRALAVAAAAAVVRNGSARRRRFIRVVTWRRAAALGPPPPPPPTRSANTIWPTRRPRRHGTVRLFTHTNTRAPHTTHVMSCVMITERSVDLLATPPPTIIFYFPKYLNRTQRIRTKLLCIPTVGKNVFFSKTLISTVETLRKIIRRTILIFTNNRIKNIFRVGKSYFEYRT